MPEVAILGGIISAVICDFVRREDLSETAATRKTLVFFGVTIGTSFLFLLRFVSCRESGIVIALGMSAVAYSAISVQAVSLVTDVCISLNRKSLAFFCGWINLFAVGGMCSSVLVHEAFSPIDSFQEDKWQHTFDLVGYSYFIAMFLFILLVEDEKKNNWV